MKFYHVFLRALIHDIRYKYDGLKFMREPSWKFKALIGFALEDFS